MQSYDQNDKIVQSGILDDLGKGKTLEEMNELLKQKSDEIPATSIPQQIRKLMQTAEKKGAVRHVIANMPNHGQEVEIGGLKFTVSYVNNRRGDVHLKLQGIADAQESAEEGAA